MSETYTYQLTARMPGMPGDPPILRLPDNAFIPPDPANRDYQEYREWLRAGNTPLDPLPPPRPQPEELQTVRVADPENDTDAVNRRTLDTELSALTERINNLEDLARRR